MNRLGLCLLALIVGCAPASPSVEEFADDPARAARVVAGCEAGRDRPMCSAARKGLAESRRRDRMAAYQTTLRGT